MSRLSKLSIIRNSEARRIGIYIASLNKRGGLEYYHYVDCRLPNGRYILYNARLLRDSIFARSTVAESQIANCRAFADWNAMDRWRQQQKVMQ